MDVAQRLANSSAEQMPGDLEAAFQVPFHFAVRFTREVFSPANSTLSRELCTEDGAPGNVLFFVDDNLLQALPGLTAKVTAYCSFHQVRLLAPPVPVKAGEVGKQGDELAKLHRQLLDLGVDRHNFVCAIGGGAVLDLVGFACSTFHRGVPLIRIPTTVLAQNDAGIGVKNGINALGHKNLLGNFCPPKAVINDFGLLATLSRRDKRAGLAEAIKVALIQDAGFFAWLEDNASALAAFEPEASQFAIYRCAQLHLHKITLGGDPFERGNGRPLDYGHWSAHKLEVLSNHRIRHGEAVAVGMLLDAFYANLVGLLHEQALARLLSLLVRLEFPLWYPELADQEAILQGLEDFRQHLGGDLSIPMLTGIGSALDVQQIDRGQMISALERLRTAEESAPGCR